jgi:hypothetical protein
MKKSSLHSHPFRKVFRVYTSGSEASLMQNKESRIRSQSTSSLILRKKFPEEFAIITEKNFYKDEKKIDSVRSRVTDFQNDSPETRSQSKIVVNSKAKFLNPSNKFTSKEKIQDESEICQQINELKNNQNESQFHCNAKKPPKASSKRLSNKRSRPNTTNFNESLSCNPSSFCGDNKKSTFTTVIPSLEFTNGEGKGTTQESERDQKGDHTRNNGGLDQSEKKIDDNGEIKSIIRNQSNLRFKLWHTEAQDTEQEDRKHSRVSFAATFSKLDPTQSKMLNHAKQNSLSNLDAQRTENRSSYPQIIPENYAKLPHRRNTSPAAERNRPKLNNSPCSFGNLKNNLKSTSNISNYSQESGESFEKREKPFLVKLRGKYMSSVDLSVKPKLVDQDIKILQIQPKMHNLVINRQEKYEKLMNTDIRNNFDRLNVKMNHYFQRKRKNDKMVTVVPSDDPFIHFENTMKPKYTSCKVTARCESLPHQDQKVYWSEKMRDKNVSDQTQGIFLAA